MLQSWLGRFGGEKNGLVLLEIEPRFLGSPVRSLVTIYRRNYAISKSKAIEAKTEITKHRSLFFFGAGRSTKSHRQNVCNCFGNETFELTDKRYKLPTIVNAVQSVAGLDPQRAKYWDFSLQAFDDVYNSYTMKTEAEIPSQTSVMYLLSCTSSRTEDRNLSTQHVTKCKHSKTIPVSSTRYCFHINSCMPASNSLVQTA